MEHMYTIITHIYN